MRMSKLVIKIKIPWDRGSLERNKKRKEKQKTENRRQKQETTSL